MDKKKLIIGNCSGFLGDRLSAAKEMVRGGRIDILTGDYLAELTMAILLKKRLKNPDGGYVASFLKQMEEVMGECLDRNIKVVANAGGLNPRGLVLELEKIAQKLGLKPNIACIEGDDLMPRMGELQNKGEEFIHLDKGISLESAGAKPISANAYLGGWGIAKALEEGADIAVGGRIADAALVIGPSAWKFCWDKEEWDKLAGAVAAGHIIECGAQATGGNYSFFEEVPSFKNIGYPIAEMYSDGSFIITKHPGTGGLVSVGTVTAQLLYEIRGHRYLTPDVTARFDTIDISQQGENRVYVRGVRGEAPTDTTKVCINVLGGFRNSMTVILTGLDIEKKAEIVEETLFENLGGKDKFDLAHVQLIRSDKENPQMNEESFAYLKISLMDNDGEKVGRLFSGKIVEMALATIPGFTLTAPPTGSTPAVKHWPALISKKHISQKVTIGGREFTINEVIAEKNAGHVEPAVIDIPQLGHEKMTSVPLGRLFAARSGDKGGNANLGLWAKTREAYGFLKYFLTVHKLKELVSDLKDFEIERYEFDNLLAVNFYIMGILGHGVAASVRSDPQAKTLGEYVRAKIIEVPGSLVK